MQVKEWLIEQIGSYEPIAVQVGSITDYMPDVPWIASALFLGLMLFLVCWVVIAILRKRW